MLKKFPYSNNAQSKNSTKLSCKMVFNVLSPTLSNPFRFLLACDILSTYLDSRFTRTADSLDSKSLFFKALLMKLFDLVTETLGGTLETPALIPHESSACLLIQAPPHLPNGPYCIS